MSEWIKKIFGASYRTTILGYATLVGSVGTFLVSISSYVKFYLDGDPSTVPSWADVGLSFSAMTAAFGLIFARDNKTSSQDAGIR